MVALYVICWRYLIGKSRKGSWHSDETHYVHVFRMMNYYIHQFGRVLDFVRGGVSQSIGVVAYHHLSLVWEIHYPLPNARLAVFFYDWVRYWGDGLFSGCC